MKGRALVAWLVVGAAAGVAVAGIVLAPGAAEALGPNNGCGQVINSAEQCGTTIVVVPPTAAGGQPVVPQKVIGGSDTAMWGES